MSSSGIKDPRWRRVRGFNKLVSGNIPANSLVPVSVKIEVPSNNLITIITHLATYAESLAAFGANKCAWIAPNFFPFHYLTDQLGQQWMPFELSDPIELSAGISYSLSGTNGDVVDHQIGWVLRGEQGYYV